MNEVYERMLKRLEGYRRRQGYSQEEMGSIFGVTQSHYSKLEQGKKVISGATLQKLSKQNIDIDFLVTGEATLRTELNDYMERCANEYKEELLQMLVWLVNRGIRMMNKSAEWGRVDYQKDIELFHLKEWNSLAKERVWYGIRRVNHLTQVQMSEILDINIKKYREIEKVNRIPDAEVLVNLYVATGVRPSFLFAEELNNLNTLNYTWKRFTPDVKKELLYVLDRAVLLFHGEEDIRKTQVQSISDSSGWLEEEDVK